MHNEPRPRLGEPRYCPGQPRRGLEHAAGAGDGPRAGPEHPAGAAAAAAEGKEGAKYCAHDNPSHTHTSPPKPYPPEAAFPTGRPQPIRPPALERTSPGVTLPLLRRQQDAQRVIWEGGDIAQAGQGAGAGGRSGGQVATGGVPRDKNRGRPACTRQGARAKARARYPGQQQLRGKERGQRTAQRGTRSGERAGARERHAGARAKRHGGRPQSACSGAWRGRRAWAQPRA